MIRLSVGKSDFYKNEKAFILKYYTNKNTQISRGLYKC